MILGEWLKSLNAIDKIILLIIYGICVYLSKITLENLIDYYDTKKEHSKFRVRFRVTPAALLSLALFYSIITYKILNAIFKIIP
tara:strand:+ start:236 stop:487 length:252 start_codon:yes stop_codon:yes gene_type:complete